MSQENVTAENSFNTHSGHSDPLNPYHGPGTIIGAGKRAHSLLDKLRSSEEDGECMGVISGSDEGREETRCDGDGGRGQGGRVVQVARQACLRKCHLAGAFQRRGRGLCRDKEEGQFRGRQSVVIYE